MPIVLAWSFPLLPFGSSPELPMFIMAILGGILIRKLREDLARQRLLKLSACLMLFWVFDALVQVMVGYGHLFRAAARAGQLCFSNERTCSR